MTTIPGAPLRYAPAGAADSIDSTDLFPGAMAAVTNLVPLPAGKNYWVCRPAMQELTDFSTFTNPDFISVMHVFGDLCIGMIASDATPGYDEPFVFDLSGATFVAITGVTGLNVPLSPSPTGAWIPPVMAVVGTKVIIAHPGYSGLGTNFFGVIDISDPTNPTYTDANTTGTALPTVPTAVANFNGRAWFAVNPLTGQPATYFTDILAPTVITAGTQILTYDDNSPLTALAGLPLSNQLGGMIQALIVFKGVDNMYQVTGDAAAGDLAKNALNIATGTQAPNSITPTPYGLMFMSPDGYRLISFEAIVSDPMGAQGAGIAVPFIYANIPSRVCAFANSDVLRVTTQNANAVDDPYEEYWYHFSRKIWSGPHTSTASLLHRWNNTFVVAPVDQLHSLARSDTMQGLTTTFSEYGVDLDWNFLTAYLPDPEQMAMYSVIETTINIARASAAGNVVAYAIDQDASVIDSVIMPAPGSATVWGAFVWGASPWLGALIALRIKPIFWTIPVVFNRMQFRLAGQSASGVIIGELRMRYQVLNYLTADFGDS